jgi:hypothetical protein
MLRWEDYPALAIEAFKQSLGHNFIPKQELGNEAITLEVSTPHPYNSLSSRPIHAPSASKARSA